MDAKILYIGQYVGFAGGIERYAWQTATLLRASGCRVDYAGTCPSRNEELFRQGFDSIVSPGDCGCDYDLIVLHKLCNVPELQSFLAKFGERLVFIAHDHDLYCPRHHYYTPFGRTNCHRRFNGLRCLMCSMATRPGNWMSVLKGSNGRLLKLLTGQRAIVLSHFMEANLLKNGFAPEKVSVIPPFVECGDARNEFCPQGRLRILFLGQLIRGKGVDLLLDALAAMTRPFDAVIAGDGKDRGWLESLANEKGLTNVHFAGWLSEPEKCFAEADVVAFPSRWQEPFGLCGIEAMAHGVPVAGFSVGGAGEWLVDGETGLAVPELQTNALAAAFDRLAAHPELLAAMSGKCIDIVKRKFSKENFLKNFEKILN